MYGDILVPTDGSEAVDGAVEHALELADTYDATVHALYVVQPLYAPEPGFDQVYTAMEEEGETAVQRVLGQAESVGLARESAVLRGEPHRQILEYADDNDVDLIAMGTHGRTGLDRYLVGSVTEKIVRLSPVPVLTVRHEADDAGEEPAPAELDDEHTATERGPTGGAGQEEG